MLVTDFVENAANSCPLTAQSGRSVQGAGLICLEIRGICSSQLSGETPIDQTFFRHVLARLSKWRSTTHQENPPQPAAPVAILGDVHGRADLFEKMLVKLVMHEQAQKMRIILTGDLIDRGPDAAQVLAQARALNEDPAPFSMCLPLMGNHERMALDFLTDPVGAGPRWLANGASATLSSYGLNVPHSRAHGQDRDAVLTELRDALAEVMGRGLQDWLTARPLFWHENNLFVSHAGADPARALNAQTEATLLWDRSGKDRKKRADGVWVAQGHLIQPQPIAKPGRILVDTGAWRSNCLSAALLDETGLKFIQVRSDTP